MTLLRIRPQKQRFFQGAKKNWSRGVGREGDLIFYKSFCTNFPARQATLSRPLSRFHEKIPKKPRLNQPKNAGQSVLARMEGQRCSEPFADQLWMGALSVHFFTLCCTKACKLLRFFDLFLSKIFYLKTRGRKQIIHARRANFCLELKCYSAQEISALQL